MLGVDGVTLNEYPNDIDMVCDAVAVGRYIVPAGQLSPERQFPLHAAVVNPTALPYVPAGL